jgi:hypothetical protein
MSSPFPTPQLLDGWVTTKELARQVKKHERTVKRWTQEPNGLPYANLGNTTIHHMPTTQEWLLGRLRKPNPRRSNP